MSKPFRFWKKRYSPITSPSDIQDKDLNKGGSHDAVDLAQEIAYRFGWTKSPDGGIYDEKGKRKIADDVYDLLFRMIAKGWVYGEGVQSRIDTEKSGIGGRKSSDTAVDRLLE